MGVTGRTAADPTVANTAPPPADGPGALPAMRQHPAGPMTRARVVVLSGRSVRRRTPSATWWRLIEYDPVTDLPLSDVANRWEPAGPPAVATRPVSSWVLTWITSTLGHPAAVGGPADAIAGPSSWYVHLIPDTTSDEERGRR